MPLPWSHIRLIALILLFTVLGHDAVMAGNPHAASHQHHEHQLSAAHSGHGTSGFGETVPDAGGPLLSPEGERPCGSLDALRPPAPAPDLLSDRIDAGIIQPRVADRLPRRAPDRGNEPDHPPDVRRALLQVFLN